MIALDAVTPLSQIPEKPRKVIRMQTGGDPEKKLAEGPPENIDMLPRFEGFEPGPNQFMLPEEETVIPSEPDVQPRTMDQRGELGPFVIPDKPMSSEPFFDTDMGTLRPEMNIEDRFFYGPVIRPQEVYPMDPDPGIMGILPNPNMPMRNMPQLLEANLQNVGNNGIMNFNLDLIKKLNYEKPFGSYNV
jgi:hypothetical protein